MDDAEEANSDIDFSIAVREVGEFLTKNSSVKMFRSDYGQASRMESNPYDDWGYVVVCVDYINANGAFMRTPVRTDEDDHIDPNSDVVLVKVFDTNSNISQVFAISPLFIKQRKAERLMQEIVELILLQRMAA